jgi:hypothetical protein
MRDPELVARAERAARRLESAWERWRAQHGLASAPGQPIVSYVGYSLTEPWGEPRVVIGIDADEAEYLAEFLDLDESAQHVQVPRQQAMLAGSPQEGGGEYTGAALIGAPGVAGIGLQSPDQVRDMTPELVAGWPPGELADQTAEQPGAWPGGPTAADQPPANA